MTLNLADLPQNNGGKKISFDREIYTGTAKVSGFVKAKSSWPSKWTAVWFTLMPVWVALVLMFCKPALRWFMWWGKSVGFFPSKKTKRRNKCRVLKCTKWGDPAVLNRSSFVAEANLTNPLWFLMIAASCDPGLVCSAILWTAWVLQQHVWQLYWGFPRVWRTVCKCVYQEPIHPCTHSHE